MAVGEWQGAAVSYVNALSLNPGAEYVWEYLGGALAEDLNIKNIEALEDRNLRGFSFDWPERPNVWRKGWSGRAD